ncbi:MAG: helix-turn-helix domain-containing protein [Treponema sp.]|nr:helix-turn-helix domain-containing protein [Treponema sp.]
MEKKDYNIILTVKDVAELFKVEEQTVYHWASNGTLPSFKIGKVIRFRRDEIFGMLDI